MGAEERGPFWRRFGFSTGGSEQNPTTFIDSNGNAKFGGTVNYTGVQSFSGAILSTSSIKSSSPTAGIGYATGAGGSVSQATNRSTGVTVTGMSGTITTDATSLAAAAEATFTVTNTSVAIGDVPVVAARGGQSAGTSVPIVTAVANGSFDITLTNLGAGADTGAMVINWIIFKAVSS